MNCHEETVSNHSNYKNILMRSFIKFFIYFFSNICLAPLDEMNFI